MGTQWQVVVNGGTGGSLLSMALHQDRDIYEASTVAVPLSIYLID